LFDLWYSFFWPLCCLFFFDIWILISSNSSWKMNCGVRLHDQNACYVIFWNIAHKHWIYMNRGYCNSFHFYLWLDDYWEYIQYIFAVEGHIILKIWSILRILSISSCTSFLDFKYRIWWYHYWLFNPTNISS
jgi:hypothetical protein